MCARSNRFLDAATLYACRLKTSVCLWSQRVVASCNRLVRNNPQAIEKTCLCDPRDTVRPVNVKPEFSHLNLLIQIRISNSLLLLIIIIHLIKTLRRTVSLSDYLIIELKLN